ncbi:hypothetical protein ACHAPV_003820 [Trichoderma viride]
MYRILFPEDTGIPSPYKDEPPYRAEELGVWIAAIERTCNSPSLTVRERIEQIRDITEQAIRHIESESSRAQDDLQETAGASNTGFDSFLEYMEELSTEITDDQLSEIAASVLESQDDSTPYVDPNLL